MLTPLLLIAALAVINMANLNEQPLANCSLLDFFIGICCLSMAVHLAARMIIRFKHTLSKSSRLPTRLDQISQLAALGIFSYWALSSPWIAQQSLATLCILPLLVVQLSLWWSISACYGLRNIKKRWSFLLLRIRFEILPALVLILFIDLINNIVYLSEVEWSQLEKVLIHIAFAIPILLFMPGILLKCWSCKAITDPQMLNMLQSIAQQSKVSVRGFYTWPRRGVPFYNAMAAGFGKRFQVVIISQDLLDALSEEEIQAVIGHELGHLRYRHLLIYLALLFTMSTVISWLISISETWWQPYLDAQYHLSVNLTLHAILILIAIRWIFGLVSRACEGQADLHGARVSSFSAMQSALHKVAMLVGQDLDTPNWRHHSIAQRITNLAQHPQNPQDQDRPLHIPS